MVVTSQLCNYFDRHQPNEHEGIDTMTNVVIWREPFTSYVFAVKKSIFEGQEDPIGIQYSSIKFAWPRWPHRKRHQRRVDQRSAVHPSCLVHPIWLFPEFGGLRFACPPYLAGPPYLASVRSGALLRQCRIARSSGPSNRIWRGSSGGGEIHPPWNPSDQPTHSSRVARKRISGQRSSVRLRLTRVGARYTSRWLPSRARFS